MAENKTKPTTVSVDSFLAKVSSAERRADCVTLTGLMRRVTRCEPKMWGPSIVGFGDYHYTYASGREGDSCLLGFSPRKDALTIYFMTGFDAHADLVPRLGKYKTGVGCLYVKRLSDIDVGVLTAMLERTAAALRPRATTTPRAKTTNPTVKRTAKKAGKQPATKTTKQPRSKSAR